MKKVIGLDLGDKQNVAVVFEADGSEHKAVTIINTKAAMKTYLALLLIEWVNNGQKEAFNDVFTGVFALFVGV